MMKQIRQGVFETNSSSTHSICIAKDVELTIPESITFCFGDFGWSRFYMGDDFCFTMYIDAVKQEYAPTSRSKDRVPFSSCSLKDYFATRAMVN